jgi:topoisomerase-4 subunit B
VLCPGLTIKFLDKNTGIKLEWCYEDGLKDYLIDAVKQFTCLPEQPFVGSFSSEQSAVDWALCWLPEGASASPNPM